MQYQVLKTTFWFHTEQNTSGWYSLLLRIPIFEKQPSPVRGSTFKPDVQLGREMNTKYIRKRKFERALKF